MAKLPIPVHNFLNKIKRAALWWWGGVRIVPDRAWILTFIVLALVAFWAGKAYGLPKIEGINISVVVSCGGNLMGRYTFPNVESFYSWLQWQQGRMTSEQLLDYWQETEGMDPERAAKLGNTLLRCEKAT